MVKSIAIFLAPLFATLFFLVSASPLGGSDSSETGIPSAVYNSLVYYFKYASSAYSITCSKPNGNVFISKISGGFDYTEGFIARDDNRKEIIVSLRGAISASDQLGLYLVVPKEFKSAGITGPDGVRVHTGVLYAWNTVAESVVATVREQLNAYPGYSIVTTGHSLGGELSSLAGITLKETFHDIPLRIYTYGQPRVGNGAFARWINQRIGLGNLFRSVHTTDPAPNLVPHSFEDYTHHGVEYWSFLDPSSAAHTKQCAADIEDPSCSASVPLGKALVTPAHFVYFDIPMATAFCS